MGARAQYGHCQGSRAKRLQWPLLGNQRRVPLGSLGRPAAQGLDLLEQVCQLVQQAVRQGAQVSQAPAIQAGAWANGCMRARPWRSQHLVRGGTSIGTHLTWHP